jgi:hypothetical protein
MKKFTSFATLLAILFLLSKTFAANPASPLEGKWLGDFKVNAKDVSFRSTFWVENDEIRGTIDLPEEGFFGLPLSWIIVDSSSIHFELVRDSGTLVFDGHLKNNIVAGDFLTKANRGTFNLTRVSFAGK